MLIIWLLSVVASDVSIVDIFWGPCLFAAGLTYALILAPAGPRWYWVLAMLALWALRLAIYLSLRNHGQPEDRRYRAMRDKRGQSFWWKSLYVVFLTQGILAWILSWPLFGAMGSQTSLGWLDALGACLVLFGLCYETIADWQLAAFLAQPDHGSGVMTKGLWRYSRHPNYFGEFCVWWGFFLFAASAGAWWTVVSPCMLSFLLFRISGVALTEKDIALRRPEYSQYLRSTSAFFPQPPKAEFDR